MFFEVRKNLLYFLYFLTHFFVDIILQRTLVFYYIINIFNFCEISLQFVSGEFPILHFFKRLNFPLVICYSLKDWFHQIILKSWTFCLISFTARALRVHIILNFKTRFLWILSSMHGAHILIIFSFETHSK